MSTPLLSAKKSKIIKKRILESRRHQPVEEITNLEFVELVDQLNATSAGGAAAWGGITGTLSSQTDLQSALDLKEDVISAGTTAQYYRGDKTFRDLDKTAVGLPNVNNTSDANKPVSTAGQTALDLKANVAAPTFTGDITSNAVSIISNSSVATTLLIGDVTLGDTITEMRLQAYGADLINLQDDEISLKSSTVKITGSLSTTAPATYLGLVSSTGVVTKRTPAQVLTDIGGAPATGGSYLPLAGGAMTGAITTNSTFDGVDIATRDGVLSTTTTTANAALPKTGGEMTGAITGNVPITGFRPYLSETSPSRTLSLTDAGTFISAENADDPTTVTIPINGTVAFTEGTEIDFIQKTVQTLTLTAASGVTLNGAVAGSVAVTAQWGGVTIKLIADDEWIAVGKI